MYTLQLYTLKEDPTLVLRVVKEEVGWLHIANLPNDRNNIFSSIEEIEMWLDKKLEFHSEREFNDDGSPIDPGTSTN